MAHARRISVAVLVVLCLLPSAVQAGWRDRAMSLSDKGNAEEAFKASLAGARQDPVEARLVAGWIALTRQNNPNEALVQFTAMAKVAKTSADRAASGYWMGRALEAKGKREESRKMWGVAAQYGFTFYGQVAAAAMGKRPTMTTDPRARFTPQEATAILSRPDGRRAIEAYKDKKAAARNSALFALSEKGAKEAGVAAWAATNMGSPETAVRIARTWAARGVTLIKGGYPNVSFKWHDARVKRELVLAVMREESNFVQSAESPVGAQGSMQVMDGTAQHVGNLTGVNIDLSMMRVSRDYNVAVGSHYLARMMERYSGNVVLSLAAYNAGPGRADQWIERYGDPRSDGVDTVDWIERIPITETRDYVKRVMSSYIVYLSITAGAS